jgi:hypothetical protein
MNTKTFDCVKMKEECQRACEKRYAGLSFEERQKMMEADILADPILGDFFRKTFKPDGLNPACNPAAVVAETASEYRTKESAK